MKAEAPSFTTNWIDIQSLLGQQYCPECGTLMRAADWLKQKDIIYIWYRCSSGHCKGSRLEKLVKASDT